jgi:hypothetical protein
VESEVEKRQAKHELTRLKLYRCCRRLRVGVVSTSKSSTAHPGYIAIYVLQSKIGILGSGQKNHDRLKVSDLTTKFILILTISSGEVPKQVLN